MSKENEIDQAVEKINSMSSKIEIIVNNAGINQVSLFQMTPIKKIREDNSECNAIIIEGL